MDTSQYHSYLELKVIFLQIYSWMFSLTNFSLSFVAKGSHEKMTVERQRYAWTCVTLGRTAGGDHSVGRVSWYEGIFRLNAVQRFAWR